MLRGSDLVYLRWELLCVCALQVSLVTLKSSPGSGLIPQWSVCLFPTPVLGVPVRGTKHICALILGLCLLATHCPSLFLPLGWDRHPWFCFCIEAVELDRKLPAFLGYLPWCYTAVGWDCCQQKILLSLVTFAVLVLGRPFEQGVGEKGDETGRELKLNCHVLGTGTVLFSHQLWFWGDLPFTQAWTENDLNQPYQTWCPIL